ncbi:MAG: hypothetical protein ACRD33_09310 [Candidatus Acidiferrales bacterium]
MTRERLNFEREFFRAAAMFLSARARAHEGLGALLGELDAMVELQMILETRNR